MRFEPARKHIPIFIASLNQKSVEFTAQKADGWLPVMIPVSGSAKRFRNSTRSQKPPVAIPNRRGQGARGVVIVKNVERAKAGQAGTIAFYAARMGTFYSEQLTRFGFGDEVAPSSRRGTRAAPRRDRGGLAENAAQLGYVGDVEGARERIIEHEKAGADLHAVEIDAKDPAEFEKTVARLLYDSAYGI